MQQTIDTTEIDECAVVGDVLDDTGHDGALFQGFHQLRTLFAHRGFDNGTTRQHHVVALAVELDDSEFHGLAFVRRGVLDRAGVDQRTGQEGTDTVGQNGQTAFDLAADSTSHQLARLHRFFEREPACEALCLVTREDGVTETIFERLDGNGDEVTNIDFELTIVIFEFFDRDERFGLQSGVNDHEIMVKANDFSRDDLTRAHILALQRFSK